MLRVLPWIGMRDYVELLGFHIFAGSQNLNADILCEAQRATVALALRLAETMPAPVRYLNIGGGFGIPYSDRDAPLDLDAIGENLEGLMADAIRDGEVLTACQAACPTGAIVFGNVNDPTSQVARLKAEPRNYALLGELNTRPRTTYLTALRNPNPAAGAGAGV